MGTIRVLFVSRILKRMRGASRSLLAEASDGQLHVVKLAERVPGEQALFNESLGTELYRLADLPVPDWRPMWIPTGVLDEAASFGFITDVPPLGAICFASRYLGQHGARIFEILPGSGFSRIANANQFWVAQFLDLCANHCDNRQAIFRERPDRRFEAIFIDHGNMFGGPDGKDTARAGRSQYLDNRVYPPFSSEHAIAISRLSAGLPLSKLWRIADSLPADWKTDAAVRNLEMCCSNLGNPAFREACLDRLFEMSRSPVVMAGPFRAALEVGC